MSEVGKFVRFNMRAVGQGVVAVLIGATVGGTPAYAEDTFTRGTTVRTVMELCGNGDTACQKRNLTKLMADRDAALAKACGDGARKIRQSMVGEPTFESGGAIIVVQMEVVCQREGGVPAATSAGGGMSRGAAPKSPPAAAASGSDKQAVMTLDEYDALNGRGSGAGDAAHQKRLQSKSRLEQLIKDFDGSAEQKAEMIMRLADLEYEEGHELHLAAMRDYRDALDTCAEATNPPCDRATVKIEGYTSRSREWYEKAIKHYRQILESYPTFVRTDEAIFQLGVALRDIGQSAEANDEFTRLAKTHPESAKLVDAYVFIGEYWFDQNQMFKALTAYQKAAAWTRYETYAFASYKLAWCYFNVGDPEKAIATMKSIVADANSGASTLSPSDKLFEAAMSSLRSFGVPEGEISGLQRGRAPTPTSGNYPSRGSSTPSVPASIAQCGKMYVHLVEAGADANLGETVVYDPSVACYAYCESKAGPDATYARDNLMACGDSCRTMWGSCSQPLQRFCEGDPGACKTMKEW